MTMDALIVNGFLADSVASAEGKLYVQGAGWNVINAASLPARHSRIGIGVLIHVPYLATNQPHVLELTLEDADGGRLPLGDAPPAPETPDGKVRSIRAEFNVGRPATIHPGDEQLVPIAINVDQLTFDREDQYSFVVRLDGTEMRRLSFRVNLVKQIGVVVPERRT